MSKNTNVIMFIERINKGYKGHIFINGRRQIVCTDTDRTTLKASMEWEVNTVYNLESCNVTWLKCNLQWGCKNE